MSWQGAYDQFRKTLTPVQSLRYIGDAAYFRAGWEAKGESMDEFNRPIVVPLTVRIIPVFSWWDACKIRVAGPRIADALIKEIERKANALPAPHVDITLNLP
jgi:hypothetical protein